MQVLRIRAALAVAILMALGVAASVAQAATVTIRIEGETETLLPRTTVTTSNDPVPGTSCAGNTVGGAIEVATKGNWDRQAYTNTILGETHDFSHNDYWFEWLNNRAGNGVCNDTVNDGDDIVMLVDISGPNYEPSVFPIVIEGVPGSIQRGAPFTVTVVEYYSSNGYPGTGTRTPLTGATVGGGGATETTDAQGHATLSMPSTGSFTLRAVKSASARSASEPVCVHDGDDGTCGTNAPGVSGGVLSTTAPAFAVAPVSKLLGLRSGQRFSARRAPRLLRGHVDIGSGALEAVRLRLRRVVGGECFFWSVKAEKWRERPCDAGGFFYRIGDRADWSYLMPARLGPGRYDLHAKAVDRAGLSYDAYVMFRVARPGG